MELKNSINDKITNMICPRCNTVLTISIMQGIEIDYCSNCRGVWLDRGELEKIIERSNTYNASYMGVTDPFNDNDHDHKKCHSHHDDHHDGNNRYGNPHRQRKGFLSDLFDF